jgi:hypothetical protein
LGGLKGVIEKLGDAPPEHKWKSFPQCPFCGHKDSAGIWMENGAEFFKCYFSECNTGRHTVTEMGYIAMRLAIGRFFGDYPPPAPPAVRRPRSLWLALICAISKP